MFIELTSIVIAFIFLLYYAGIGLTRLIIPERFKDYEILIIPFIGLFVVLFFAHIFGFIGLGSRTFTWIILAIIIPLNFYAIKRNGLPSINPSETLPVLFIAAIAFLVGMLPLLKEGYLTVVGTSGDAAHYTALADHFMTNGLTPPQNKGIWYTNWIAFLLGPDNVRVGPMYFQSIIGAITGLEGYKTFSVVINLFHALLLCSTFIFIRAEDILPKKASFLVICLLAINSALYWLAIDDFLAQTMMVSVLPLSVATLFHMLREKSYMSIAFSVAISSTILMVSAESMVLIIAPLFLFAVAGIFRKEFTFKENLKLISIWTVALIIINALPLRAFLEFANKFQAASIENVGNVRYFIPLTQVLGLTPPYHHLYRVIANNENYATTSYLFYFYISYASVFIALLLIGYALFRYVGQKRTVLISIFAPYLFITLYFRFTFPYGYFKITSSTLFITIILITAGIWLAFSSRLPLILKAAISIVAVSIVSLSLTSLYILFDMVINDDNEEWLTINRELIALRDSQYIKKEEPVLIEERLGRGNKYYWIAYLLQDREVLTRKALPGTESFRDKELSFNYVIDGGYRYQQYIADGWTPVITTSRYILLSKGKR